MIKKRIFISCRINEMRLFREAAIKAIEAARMEPLYFDSTDPQKRWELKPGVPIILQLLEGVRTADAFLGILGETLNTNWTPDGYDKHSMELEYETAVEAGLPCFFYVPPSEGSVFDDDMVRFRRRVMQRAVDFLSIPEALYADLLTKLSSLKPRIFVSYSSKDQVFVDQLFARLKESGYFAWLNTESITKGFHWHEEMMKGLGETDILLLVVSPDSIASNWVKQEWKFFLQSGKKVLPILLRETKVPVSLSKIEMIKVQAEGWYYRLIKAIEQTL